MKKQNKNAKEERKTTNNKMREKIKNLLVKVQWRAIDVDWATDKILSFLIKPFSKGIK